MVKVMKIMKKWKWNNEMMIMNEEEVVMIMKLMKY